METKSCPTCLSRLLDGGEKRCPACRARIRTRTRRAARGESTATSARPLLLVERELQARIEAQTAANFWQRRRAARAARRIAALPPSLFQGGVVVDAETETWAPQSKHASWNIVDVPAEAIHEVTSIESVAQLSAEAVVEHAFNAPTPGLRRRAAKAARRDDARADVIDGEVALPTEAAEGAVVAEPFEVPTPADPVVDPAAEPAVERIVEPVPDLVLPATTSWQPPNPVWIGRVFSAARGPRRMETVTWPRPLTPVAPAADFAGEANRTPDRQRRTG